MSTGTEAVVAQGTDRVADEAKQVERSELSASAVSEISGGADACQILGGALGGAIGALGGPWLGAIGGAIGAATSGPCPAGEPTVQMGDITAP